MLFIPKTPPENGDERFDFLGAVLFMAGLTALLLGLNQGHAWGWTSWRIGASVAISAAFLAAFILLERRVQHPMLDLSLFHSRVFSTSVIAAVLNYVCMATIGFLMPYYLHDGRHLQMRIVGLLLSVQPLVMAVVAPISGTVSDRIRSSLPSAIGMGILAVGTLVMSGIGPETSFGLIAAAFCVTGLGTGIFISPNNSALMGAAPKNRQGIASGMMSTSRNVGMVLGVGLSGAVLTTALSDNRSLIDGIVSGLHVATVAAVLGSLVSLARPKQDETVN
jgi:MFS family permease